MGKKADAGQCGRSISVHDGRVVDEANDWAQRTARMIPGTVYGGKANEVPTHAVE